MSSHARLAALATLAATACASPVTAIVVVVDTDLCIPSELDFISIESTRGDAIAPPAERDFTMPGPGLPLTRTIVASPDNTGPLEVTVRGHLGGATGALIVSRQARVEFVPGQQRVLRLGLSRECVPIPCGDGLTCNAGSCAPIEAATLLSLDEDALREQDAGACMPPVDGGIDDAALDAPTDAPTDGGCTCDADKVPCTRDECGPDGGCLHTPVDSLCTAEPNGRCDESSGCAYCAVPWCGTNCCDDIADVCRSIACNRALPVPVCEVGNFDDDPRCAAAGCILTATCMSGSCVRTPGLCPTGNPCMLGACDLDTGACVDGGPAPEGTNCTASCCAPMRFVECDGMGNCPDCGC